MNNEEQRILEGFRFSSEEEYKLAKKELETIHNIESKVSLADAKAALQIYNKAVSNGTFKTVIGYAFLLRLRETIVSCEIVKEDILNPIPVMKQKGKKTGTALLPDQEGRYKVLYENERNSKKIYKLVIAFMAVIIIGIFAVSLSNKYSFITYFTNYEEKIRNEVIDEYETWQADLEEREKILEESQEQAGGESIEQYKNSSRR